MPGPAQNRGAGGGLPLPTVPKAKSTSGGSTGGGSSSYPMSSSLQPKSKSGSGIKILWIPGRKKHHDKGVYKPNNYKIEHKHDDRKTEPWSLGGSKSHDDIISGGDKDDKVDLIKSSTPTPTSTVLPSASLGVATTVNIDDCSESDSEIKLEKQNDFDSIERLDDLDGQPKLSHQNGFKPKSTCKKTKEDKAVKCLYYTMMCCECTIS